ncbi:hypothetical protein AB833_25480 [Chromatiales bacterium (ex Bugula neritina AB1)]|nr:hypothetical protein AB833_25480 [Chromatiales bacterium (ex Bugula neritina AB1)]
MNSALTCCGLAALIFGLSGCFSAESPEDKLATEEPAMASAFGESSASTADIDPDTAINEANVASTSDSLRRVVVYLTAQAATGFFPEIAGRIVDVSFVHQQSTVTATARLTTNGIETFIVGASCANLQTRYPDLLSCEKSETTRMGVGEIATSARSDQEGFLSFSVLRESEYQLDLKSRKTREDDNCYWGGSVVLPAQVTSLELPMHVYCE